MRIHFFEHDPMEGIGTFGEILAERSWSATHTLWDRGGAPPEPETWDLLVVMGGPMNVYEDVNYEWLPAEKAYLDRALALDRPILGVCLGAQLLAERLGAAVTRNEYTEIGWSHLSMNPAARAPGQLFEHFSDIPCVFQWHGDTFAIPTGATPIGSTPGCANQGFVKGNSVGIQFHLELTPDALKGLIKAQPHFRGTYIQKPDIFLAKKGQFHQNRDLLAGLLDRISDRMKTPEPS